MKKTVKPLFLLFLFWEVPDNLLLFKKFLMVFFFLWSSVLKAINHGFLLISPVFLSDNYLQFRNVPPLKPKAFRNWSSVSLLKISFIFAAQFHLYFLAVQSMAVLKIFLKTLNGQVPFTVSSIVYDVITFSNYTTEIWVQISVIKMIKTI